MTEVVSLGDRERAKARKREERAVHNLVLLLSAGSEATLTGGRLG